MFNRWERKKKGMFQTSEKRTGDDLITDLSNLSIVNETAESSSGENTDNEIISENNEIQLVRTEQPKSHAAHCECKCANSQALLTRYAECRICFEPLQSHGPCACPSCGGIWCSRCTKHLPRCPWCRAPMRSPAPPCLPLQRFLNDMELPCRNYKHGCTILLQGSQRMNHEIVCDRESVGCPIKANCCEIKFKELGEHLQSAHDVIAVYSQKVKILIENFQTKLKKTASNRAKYKIVLLNHKSAFIIRVCLFNYHIKVECMRQQLGYAASSGAKQKNQYFAKVEFQNEALKTTLCEHNIGIENEAYGMKAEAQWNASNVNQNESLAIHVAIDIVNPESFGKQKLTRKRSK